MEINKSNHYDLLNSEYKKNKTKHVNFSLFNADSLEEMERLRKEKEVQLLGLLQFKEKANESCKQVERSSRSNPLSNIIVKAENIFLQNQMINLGHSILEEEKLNSNVSNIRKDKENSQESKISSEREMKEIADVLEKESKLNYEEHLLVEEAKKIQDIQVNTKEHKTCNIHIEDVITHSIPVLDTNDIIERNVTPTREEHKREELLLKIEEVNCDKQQHIESAQDDGIINENFKNIVDIYMRNIEEVKVPQITQEECYIENAISRVNDIPNQSKEKLNNLSIADNVSEIKVESIHEEDLTLIDHKSEAINPFISNIPTFIEVIDQIILDNHKANTMCFFHRFKEQFKCLGLKRTQKSYQAKLAQKYSISQFRSLIQQRNNRLSSILKYKQYQLYLNFKRKSRIFNMIKSHKENLLSWIQTIQLQRYKQIAWDCIDSWKVYSNYKKVKSFIKEKKKRKIFLSLKSHMTNQRNIHRISNLLKFILCTRNSLQRLRKFSLNQSIKKTNQSLSKEFRRTCLLKKIFRIFSQWHDKVKFRSTKPIRDSSYIKLSVAQKETICLNKDKKVVIRKLTNNIKII